MQNKVKSYMFNQVNVHPMSKSPLVTPTRMLFCSIKGSAMLLPNVLTYMLVYMCEFLLVCVCVLHLSVIDTMN